MWLDDTRKRVRDFPEAARKFGVTQPRINDLLRGKIDKFSLDALVNMLGKGGLRVEIQVRKAA